MTNDMGRTVTKSIAIIGEGETEWFYFDSLRVACRYPFKVAPDFPQHSDIKHMLNVCLIWTDCCSIPPKCSHISGPRRNMLQRNMPER